MKQKRRRRLVGIALLLCAAALWWRELPGWSLSALALTLLVLLVRRRQRRRRRGAQSHVNADGSPKRAYRSLRAARVAADEYERDFGDSMNAYRCARGRHWHIGHSR